MSKRERQIGHKEKHVIYVDFGLCFLREICVSGWTGRKPWPRNSLGVSRRVEIKLTVPDDMKEEIKLDSFKEIPREEEK